MFQRSLWEWKRLGLLVVLVGGLCVGLGCYRDQVEYVDEATMEKMRQQESVWMSPIVEEELATWEPDHEDLVPMISDIHKPDMEIAGSWTTLMILDGSTLEIQENEDGTYSIDFSTGGCLSNWDLKRTGTYANGVLRLDKPVEEYGSSTYDTLYPVRVDGLDYLISQSRIRSLYKHYATDGKVKWPEHIDYHAFHRKSDEGNKEIFRLLQREKD